jgi:hypothetical protein
VIEPAQQRSAEVLAGELQAGDLLVEGGESPPGDRLPRVLVQRIEDAGDVGEREAGVLQHPDEHQPSQRGGVEAALARAPRVGGEQATALVEADGRRRHAGAAGELADRQQPAIAGVTRAHPTT